MLNNQVLDSLLNRVNQNKVKAVDEYCASDEDLSGKDWVKKPKSEMRSSSKGNIGGLFLVLWKNKYAFIVNAKGEVAAKVSFDDFGKI